MKNILVHILGFILMVLGIQGAIRLLANGDKGLLGWLNLDVSLLIALNVVIAVTGIYILKRFSKKT